MKTHHLFATIALGALFFPAQTAAQNFTNQFRNTLATGGTYWYAGTGSFYQSPGTWFFSDATFMNTGTENPPTQLTTSAIYINANGEAGSAVFSGSNIAAIGKGSSGSGRQAISVRNAGVVYIYGGTVAQDNASADAGTSEALYLVGKSKFTGEDLVISANAPQVRGISLANDSDNVLTLRRSHVSTSANAPAANYAGSGVMLFYSSTIYTSNSLAPGIHSAGGLGRLVFDGGEIHTMGENSAGLWLGNGDLDGGPGEGFTKFEASLKNVSILAENSAAIDINNRFSGQAAGPSVSGPTIFWQGNYQIDMENSTIEGNLGSLRITSCATTASFQVPTYVSMNVKNSTLKGDVEMKLTSNLQMSMIGSTVDGDFNIHDNSNATLKLDAASTIAGNMTVQGLATLSLDMDGATVSGSIAASGTTSVALRLSRNATFGGNITLSDAATLQSAMDASSRISGDIEVSPNATFNLLNTGDGALNIGKVSLAGHWRINGKAVASSQVTLTGGAAITLACARGDDLVLANGISGSGLLTVETVSASLLNHTEIRIIADNTGAMSADTFALTAPIDLGLAAYTLENRPDGAYLVGGLGNGNYGAAASAIFNTHALAPIDWFYALEPVHGHLSSLRDLDLAGKKRIQGDAGTLWAQIRTGNLTADPGNAVLYFDQYTTSFTIGADTCWSSAKSAFTSGLFGSTSRTARDFMNDADGTTAGIGAGIYASWSAKAGWYMDAVARFDAYKHDFDTHNATNPISADYRTNAYGASLEFGHRLAARSGVWWIEPALQAALVRFDSADYTTESPVAGNVISVKVDAINAAQYRAQARFGWNPEGSRLRFYGSIAAAYSDANGGAVHAPGAPVTSYTIDGWYGEASVGFAADLGGAGRLFLDLQSTTASDYNRPWTLSLGYNIVW